MRYQVRHITAYHYSAPVSLCHNELHLIPRSYVGQRCLHSALQIQPTPRYRQDRHDFFGNPVSFVTIEQTHSCLELIAESTLERMPHEVTPGWGQTAWEQAVLKQRHELDAQWRLAHQFTYPSPLIPPLPALHDYVQGFFPPGRCLYEAVSALMEGIYTQFQYTPGLTTVSTPLSEVLNHRCGVCQDFAHLAIGCLRSLGLAARYVSGYLETLPPPGQTRLQGADASHAWFAVLDPATGWLDFDPTNNLSPGPSHLTLAWGRDYSDVTPLKGVVFGGGEHQLSVSVDVIRETAPSTSPSV